AFTALALDRAGHGEQGRAAAREATGPWELERALTADDQRPSETRSFVFPSAELGAAIAMLAEGRDPKLAEAHWRAFLADPRASRGAWAAHAKQKLALPARAPQREKRGG
ncbi:MAG TPA: hypothetical protein VGP93_02685, partial [Polyangiaceae bacterium]|nr:hypothetical protein [Polyangiaceae bacterium]